ncbi:MAG: hypothetical protein V1765_01075, partial [bacterium]
MKRFLTSLAVLIFVLGSNLKAQYNAEFYFVQPDDWNYTTNQAQLDLYFSSAVDFYQLAGEMKVSLTNSDGILDTIIPARFPMRDTLVDIIDSTKWSFVNEVAGDDHNLTYNVRYVDSNRTDGFSKGFDILMLEEFILFRKWPTYGQLTIELSKIRLTNINNDTMTTNNPVTFIVNFGSGPVKERPFLEWVLPELKADAQIWYADLYLTNKDYVISGLLMSDLLIDSCLFLADVEAIASANWSTMINLISTDNLGDSHYSFAALANSLADYIPTGPRRPIYRFYFQPKTGCLAAGDLISLAFYGASITDNGTPINEVLVDDFAISIRVAPGEQPCPKGDVDFDGDRDLDDVIFYLQYLTEIIDLDP